jgi:hypothetical protein
MNKFIWFIVGMLVAVMAFQEPRAIATAGKLPDPIIHTDRLPPDPDPIPPMVPDIKEPASINNPVTAVGSLGLSGGVECWNCAPFRARIRVTNYDPMLGDINCWDYDNEQKYCYSPMQPGIHWKSFYGLAAACPMEYKLGTWVTIPEVGTFICMDRGNLVICDDNTGICNIDILGPGGLWWNGKIFDVTLWVPLDPPRGGE